MITKRQSPPQGPLSLTAKQKTVLMLLAVVLFAIPVWLGLERVHSAPARSAIQPLAMATPTPPAPIVSIDLPSEVLIGEDFQFEVKFKNNTGAGVGYAPYIDLYFPAWGADGNSPDSNNINQKCDGISFMSAKTLFTTPPSLPLPDVFDSGVSGLPPCPQPYTTHPFTGATVLSLTPQYQLVVLALPFGSFDPTQPEIIVNVTAHLSDYADAGTPLTIYAKGGFRYGSDEFDNHPADPLIESAQVSDQTTPTVLKIKKEYLGPEDEAVSGPNFTNYYPLKYKLTADFADQQTINNLVITDNLPNNLQFKGNVQVTIQGNSANPVASCSATPGPFDIVITPPLPPPGGTLSVKLCSPLKGSTAPDDVVVTFDFYIPNVDANNQLIILKNCSNAPVAVKNDILATGDWDPLDPRDPLPTDPPGTTVPINNNLTNVDHILNAKCLAIQKSVTMYQEFPGGAIGPTPGDILKYELRFQVSDYFTIGQLVVTDFLADGQAFIAGPPPTLKVTDLFGNTGSPTAFPAGTVTTTLNQPVAAAFCPVPLQTPQLGTIVKFNVSAAMLLLPPPIPRHLAGMLAGGWAAGPATTTPATGTIVFYASISDTFKPPVTAIHKFVDKHDPINNCVRITGVVYDNKNRPTPINLPINIPTVTLGNAVDSSAVQSTIVPDTLKKTVWAVRRGTTKICGPSTNTATTTSCSNLPNAAEEVRPGDQVTFRIEKYIPSSDAEDLLVEDWLPLPIFDVSDPDGNSVPGPPWSPLSGLPCGLPGPGAACTWPSNSIQPIVTPLFSVISSTNSINFNYGTFNDPANQKRKVDLVFTLTVNNKPFADGLFQTNEVRECENNSFGARFCQTSIAQVKVREPKLQITKGVVATDNPHGVFTPALNPTGVWQPYGSSCPHFQNGPITSATLGGLINSNLSNVDANDHVTFGIAIENTGGAPACEIELADIIPLDPLDKPWCFDADFSSLCITDGSGTPIAFTTAIGGHGRKIIKLAPGFCLAPGSPSNTTGTNIAIITFNAQLHSDITPGCCDNVAQLLQYTSQQGGPNFVDAGLTPPFSDAATVCVNPTLTKSLVATSELHTAGSDVAIGEIARYRLEVIVPEGGVLPNFQVTDALPAGLKFLNDGSARIAFVSNGPGITRGPLLTPAYNLNSGSPPSSGALTALPPIPAGVISVGSNCGDDPVFSLVNVQNNDNDFDLEYIVIEFNALVCNVAGNQSGTTLPNTFSVSVGGNQIATSNQINVLVVEPQLTMTKTVAPNPALSGQTLTYTVQYTNNGTADAFDVVLKDTLPAGLTLGTVTAGCTVTTALNLLTMTCAQVPKAPNPGSTVIVTYQAVANPATCPVTLNNQATLTWTSLPGSNGTLVNPTGSITPLNPGLFDGERDGVTPSLTLNDYAATASTAVKIDCPCCLQVSNETLACNSNGSFNYKFTLTNLSGATVAGVNFSPSAGVTITPSSLAIPPLANGASTNVTVTIGGPAAVSGATVCFAVGIGGPAAPSCRVQHCVTLPACQASACATPPPGMVAWWPLDEENGAPVVNDIAGFNNQGVPKPGGQVGISGPTPTLGEVNGSLYFAGPYVEVPPQAELDFGSGDFSIDSWVRPVDCSHGAGGVRSPIVDKLAGATGFLFYLDQPTVGVANLYLNINGSTFMCSGTIPTLGSATWSHVAVTVTRPLIGTAVGTFYINGSAAGTFTPPLGNVTTNTLPLWIGKTRIGGSCEIAIDEVELFNRALQPAEVQSIAGARNAGKCKCLLATNEKISCNTNGTFSYTLTVTNLSSSTVSNLVFSPGTSNVTITPSSMTIPPLLPGNSTTVTVTISGPGAVSGANICFIVGLTGVPPAPGCRAQQCITLPTCQMACAPQPAKMVSWWPLNETSGNTVVDIIGAHNGTTSSNIGSGPFSAPLPKVGNALYFANSNATVSGSPHNFGTSNFSIDAWVRGNLILNSSLGIVDKLDTSSPPTGFAFFVRNSRVQLVMGNGTNSPTTFMSGGGFTYGTWQHVAATVQRTGVGSPSVTFYINGASAGTFVTLPPNSVNNGVPLLIGSYRLNGLCQSCEVALDEVEIFSDVVSASDIQSIFHAGSVGKCP